MNLLDILKGIAAGTLTGISPGVHVNTIAVLGGSFVFLFSMGLTHTFLDAIPSTFLGVPDEGTALAVLPAHRMVLRGRGMEVVELAMKASFMAVIFSILLYPPYTILAPLYRPIYGKIAVIILIILMVITDRVIEHSIVLMASGVLGVIVLREMTLRHPLFHLFTGLFGMPVLIHSIAHPGKVRDAGGGSVKVEQILVSSLIGSLLGMLASLLPAFTASQAAVIGSLRERNDVKFLSIVYSVNTANFMFCVFNRHITGRARNGVVASMTWSPGPIVTALIALVVALVVLSYGTWVGRLFIALMRVLDQRKLSTAVMVFLVVLSAWFDGALGVAVLGTATLIGMMPLKLGSRRTACMGVLMVPLLVTGW
ncbi:MAG: hypothetical protein GXO14_05180 [Thermococci archaeon]|nr:hypothetical protein [Thermococci archaeon]